jgi:hypothetical protein
MTSDYAATNAGIGIVTSAWPSFLICTFLEGHIRKRKREKEREREREREREIPKINYFIDNLLPP